jgi:hypothetical protein
LPLAVLAAGCSSDDDAPEGTQTSLPQANGDSCEDPAGDVSSDIRPGGGGTEQPGIDITIADAVLTDDNQLDLTFTTAGPITQTPGTTFAVAQGAPLTPLAFEIRAVVDDGGDWGVSAITWDSVERATPVPVEPQVNGNVLTFTVPMDELPPLGLFLSFGASSVVDGAGRVIDDCSSLSTAPTVG